MKLIVDREGPIEALTEMAYGKGQSLALIYGRRRVGKTYLLTNLWPNAAHGDDGGPTAFYFTASATSPAINRQVLISEAGRWAGMELRPEDHPTWRTVFRTLFDLMPDRDLVILLDEFQYLANDESGLLEVASELNAVWEGRIQRTGGLLVVLSGSAVRTMEALKKGGSPLYGRLDWSAQLHPFDYYDAARMVEGYGPIDRIRMYAAFGGLPKYLDAVDGGRELDRNIIELLLSPAGKVRLQLETVLGQEEGLREHAKYQGILESVGMKHRRIGEIAADTGEELHGSFRTMVNRLIDFEILEVVSDFGESRNTGLRYRIADPALRMFYGLVLPNESAIAASGPEIVWKERLADQVFPRYVGLHVFEDVVRQGYLRFFQSRNLPAVERWERWRGRDRERRDVEIDVVARLLDERMLTGAAKMRTRPADASVLIEHVTALRRLSDSGRAWAAEALLPEAVFLFVSTAGFKDSFLQVAEDLPQTTILWSAEDLF